MKHRIRSIAPLTLLFALIVLLTLVLAAPWALAGEPGVSLGPALAELLGQTVWPLIAAVVAGFATIVLRKLAAKFGLEGLLAQERRLRELAHQGVALAEELAARRLKEAEIKLPGGDKLNLAVAHIMAAVPEITRSRAEALVEATLGMALGVGATGDQAV